METVELRVHGVHGTSPGAMLGVAGGEVGQVAGDGLTGIYRARGVLPYRDLEGTDVSVEAYSWGALTSGVQGFLGWVKRALWLLLLPFALVNLAYWARTGLGRGTAQSWWGAAAVRVSGLLLTVFFVLTPCVLAIDLAAWQCFRYGVPGCARIPGQLDFLAGWEPGQRIALATLLPMLTVAVLWLLSKTSMARYEDIKDALDNPPALSSHHVLLHPKLWSGTARTKRLQRLHLSAAVATVVAFSGIHMLHAARFPHPVGFALLLWATVLLSGLVLVLAAGLVTVTHEDDVESSVATTYGGGLPTLAYCGRALTPLFDTVVLGASGAVYLLHLVALALGAADPARGPAHGHGERGAGLHRAQRLDHRGLRGPDPAPPQHVHRWADEVAIGRTRRASPPWWASCWSSCSGRSAGTTPTPRGRSSAQPWSRCCSGCCSRTGSTGAPPRSTTTRPGEAQAPPCCWPQQPGSRCCSPRAP